MSLLGAERRTFSFPSIEVSLGNKYEAQGVQNEEHTSNGQDAGEDNHTKLIQQLNPLEPVPLEKHVKFSNWRFPTEKH